MCMSFQILSAFHHLLDDCLQPLKVLVAVELCCQQCDDMRWSVINFQLQSPGVLKGMLESQDGTCRLNMLLSTNRHSPCSNNNQAAL